MTTDRMTWDLESWVRRGGILGGNETAIKSSVPTFLVWSWTMRLIWFTVVSPFCTIAMRRQGYTISSAWSEKSTICGDFIQLIFSCFHLSNIAIPSRIACQSLTYLLQQDVVSTKQSESHGFRSNSTLCHDHTASKRPIKLQQECYADDHSGGPVVSFWLLHCSLNGANDGKQGFAKGWDGCILLRLGSNR